MEIIRQNQAWMNARTAIATLLSAAGMLALTAGTAAAQAFPTKTVTFVSPYVAGGVVEIVARVVGAKIGANMGATIIAEARPGANGAVGTTSVAKSAPDGHTWLIATIGHVVNPAVQPNTPYRPSDDFAGVAKLASFPLIAVAHSSLGVRSMKDFVELARSRPGKLDYMMPGIGTSSFLYTALLTRSTGIQLMAIPYKGIPPAIPDLIEGRLSQAFLTYAQALPHINSGKVVPLAWGGTRRHPGLPAVPTLAEAGFAEVSVDSWYLILMPKGTPQSIIERINAEAQKAIKDPEVVRRIEELGGEVATPMAPREVDDLVRKDYDRWRKFVIEAGIKPE